MRGREKFSDEEYWAFCMANPDLRLERTAEGEIVIAPPDGGESAYRTTQVMAELRLAWLIDGAAEAVYVYRKGQAPRVRRHIAEIVGDGPVAGFVLNLNPVWEGL
jgi:Uma2 family endonuclease